MIKQHIIYTNQDNQDFTIDTSIDPVDNTYGNMSLQLSNGSSSLYFLEADEVDEFCELLQQYKKEVWD